jgi:hypothetical protein
MKLNYILAMLYTMHTGSKEIMEFLSRRARNSPKICIHRGRARKRDIELKLHPFAAGRVSYNINICLSGWKPSKCIGLKIKLMEIQFALHSQQSKPTFSNSINPAMKNNRKMHLV